MNESMHSEQNLNFLENSIYFFPVFFFFFLFLNYYLVASPPHTAHALPSILSRDSS